MLVCDTSCSPSCSLLDFTCHHAHAVALIESLPFFFHSCIVGHHVGCIIGKNKFYKYVGFNQYVSPAYKCHQFRSLSSCRFLGSFGTLQVLAFLGLIFLCEKGKKELDKELKVGYFSCKRLQMSKLNPCNRICTCSHGDGCDGESEVGVMKPIGLDWWVDVESGVQGLLCLGQLAVSWYYSLRWKQVVLG